MAKSRFEYDILECPDDEPVVFTGPPGRLTGRLPVRNGGDASAVLRHATFRGGDLQAEASSRVRTTVLRPSNAANLRTRLRIPPETPPGEYECEVEIGGSVRRALLRVVETIDVVAQPSTLFIENRPGTRVAKQILVTNRGNVPITVGHPGGIALDDQRAECRVTRATYEALGRALEEAVERSERDDGGDQRNRGDVEGPVLSLERALGEWVRQGRNHLAETGVLGVRVTGGPVVVPPGAQVPIDLAFRVPKGLDQHTRYVGVYPLYDTDLSFVIVPGSTNGNDDSDDSEESS